MSRSRRPGAAALQNEIIDLSSLVERKIAQGRVKIALEDMMRCATVPEKELSAAKQTGGTDGQSYETRLKQYSEIRMQIAKIGTPVTDEKPTVLTEQYDASSISDEDLLDKHTKPPFVPVPMTEVDIPFILDIGRNDLSPGSLLSLSSVLGHRAFRRLMYCDLSNNDITRVGTDFSSLVPLLESLSRLENLRFLSLAGIALGVEGSTAVASFVRTNRSLTHLDLSNTALTNDGVKQLVTAFPSPKAVKNPYIDRQSDKQSEEQQFAAELAELLASLEPSPGASASPITRAPTTSAPLQWIDLHQANLVDKLSEKPPSSELLARLLSLPTLQYLNLNQNALTSTCIQRLIEHLGSEHCAVRYLDLSHTGLSARYAMELAKALRDSPTSKLEWLDLQGNRVGSDGAISFCFNLSRPPSKSDSTKATPTPTTPSAPASTALEGASTNLSSTLQFVDLRDNHIGEVGRKAISLSLRGVPVPEDFLDNYLNAEEASAAREKEQRIQEELMPWMVRRRPASAGQGSPIASPRPSSSGMPSVSTTGSPKSIPAVDTAFGAPSSPSAPTRDISAASLAPLSPVGTGLRAIQALRRLESAAALANAEMQEVKLREVPIPLPTPPLVLQRAASVGCVAPESQSVEQTSDSATQSIHTLLQGRFGRVVLV